MDSSCSTSKVGLTSFWKICVFWFLFFIFYLLSATGCADPETPDGGWLRREYDRAVIGCTSTNDEWPLQCKGLQWIGHVGRCPFGTDSVWLWLVYNFWCIHMYSMFLYLPLFCGTQTPGLVLFDSSQHNTTARCQLILIYLRNTTRVVICYRHV